MCISSKPANFNQTKGYIGEAVTKEHGLVHVLGYQNKVQNKVEVPNAMILHFPASEPMSAKNVIELGDKGKGLLNYFCDYYNNEPKTRGFKNIATNGVKKSVEIFDTGIYTVVMSNKPSLITEALKEVPEEKRPDIHPELMDWYEAHYPDWPVAVCCFNSKDTSEVKADPLYWWYKPMNEDELFFPAVDCHSGGLPNLDAKVDVDHILTCGVLEYEAGHTMRNMGDYKNRFMDSNHMEYFVDNIIGQSFQDLSEQTNGDFIIKKSKVKNTICAFERVKPKLKV